MDADGDNVSLVPNTADARGNGLAWQRVVPPPAEDADSDGVVDSIDSGDAAFDDGSGTSGSIVDAAGLDVLVSDADDAGDGVKITVGAGGGRATFSVCGFTVRVSAGSEVVITCSSVTVEVVEGAAEVEFGGVVVAVPEGGKAKVSDLGGTVFRIENQGATSVAVTAAGQETTLAPGEEISLSTDTDPDADAGGPYQAVEGSSVQLTGSASGGTAPYDFLWSSIVSLSDPFVAAPTIDAVDDGTLPLSLTVTDANGSTGSDDTELTVTNADPELGSLQLPPASVPTGTPVSAQAAFTDAGLADTHTATIDWGDGSPVDAATVTGADGSGTASAGHTYTTPATYTVTLTVEDDDGGQDQVSAQVTVLGGVPVELTKTVSKAQVAVGTSVRYTLTITNTGERDRHGHGAHRRPAAAERLHRPRRTDHPGRRLAQVHLQRHAHERRAGNQHRHGQRPQRPKPDRERLRHGHRHRHQGQRQADDDVAPDQRAARHEPQEHGHADRRLPADGHGHLPPLQPISDRLHRHPATHRNRQRQRRRHLHHPHRLRG